MTYTDINAFGDLRLREGPGGDFKNGLCVMEAVAWMANEGATDHPECACPVLTSFAIRLNDRLNDENRQQLRRLILPLTGTRSEAHEQARRKYLVLETARQIVSEAFDTIGLPEHAEAFRAVKDQDELRVVAQAAQGAAQEKRRTAATAYAVTAATAYTADAYAAYAAFADYADGAAYAATAYADGAGQKMILKAIPILEGAINLGPNASDQWPALKERAEELAEFVERELVG